MDDSGIPVSHSSLQPTLSVSPRVRAQCNARGNYLGLSVTLVKSTSTPGRSIRVLLQSGTTGGLAASSWRQRSRLATSADNGK